MRLTLVSKKHLQGNVWGFIFHPEVPVTWTAGQFIRIDVPHPAPDAAGSTRWFTISGAPFEEDLVLTTRLSNSSFKLALSRLIPGQSIILLEQPAGDFVWREFAFRHIFCAQGIGITPFYAIAKDRYHRQLPIHAQLIYAHQPGHSPVFLPELRSWARQDSSFTIDIVTGTLAPPDVIALAPDFRSRFLYVSGSKSFLSLCLPPHNLPINQLLQDNFPGYSAASY